VTALPRRWLSRGTGSVRLPGGALLIHPDDQASVLAALEDGSDYRGDIDPDGCADCIHGRLCLDHARDLALARRYSDLLSRLSRR
jgi:hypothetical protein